MRSVKLAAQEAHGNKVSRRPPSAPLFADGLGAAGDGAVDGAAAAGELAGGAAGVCPAGVRPVEGRAAGGVCARRVADASAAGEVGRPLCPALGAMPALLSGSTAAPDRRRSTWALATGAAVAAGGDG